MEEQDVQGFFETLTPYIIQFSTPPWLYTILAILVAGAAIYWGLKKASEIPIWRDAYQEERNKKEDLVILKNQHLEEIAQLKDQVQTAENTISAQIGQIKQAEELKYQLEDREDLLARQNEKMKNQDRLLKESQFENEIDRLKAENKQLKEQLFQTSTDTIQRIGMPSARHHIDHEDEGQ